MLFFVLKIENVKVSRVRLNVLVEKTCTVQKKNLILKKKKKIKPTESYTQTPGNVKVKEKKQNIIVL